MKQIEKKITTIAYEYEAIDGTIFKTKEECLKYDNSAAAVIRSNYNALVVKSFDEEDLFDGSCDHSIDLIQIKTSADLDHFCQMVVFTNCIKELSEIFKTSSERALNTGELLIVCWNCDKDYVWTLGTVNQLIERINDLCNVEG